MRVILTKTILILMEVNRFEMNVCMLKLIMKKFNIILACDLGGGIGFNNNLPWDFALDKKYFKTFNRHD